MSTNFQCEYCNHYYAFRNAYAQHVGRCIKTVICSSTEESGEDVSSMVSSVNEMLLDNKDFSHIDEFQIIQEENLPSVSEVSYKFENDQDYEGDISFNGRSSNMEECENFDEILPAKESSEDVSSMVSSVNEMLLDNKDFSHIDEFQIIQEENLPSVSEVSYKFENDQDYEGDISFNGRSSNMEECENFDEILPASLRSCENFLFASLRSYDEPEEEPEVERIKEFLNEAYADLMTLVIENNLSNKARNAIIKFFNKHSDLPQSSPLPKNIKTGRKFMNKMNISQLSYSKYCILIHNEISKLVIVYYTIKEEKSYGKQNSGNWWKYAEESIPSSVFIFSIILYSDVTTTDTLGKNSLHPIYLSLGNIPTWRRNKEDAKQLLGYFPILSAKNKTEKESSDFKKLACKTFHDSIKFLLDPLFQAYTFLLTYQSANSNYPCHFCLVQKEDLIDIRKDQLILRDHVNMKEYFNNGTSNSAGLEQVNNYFWNILNLNIYMATLPDRMHHLDLGLFKYQIEFTMELLKLKSGKLVDDMNKRIAKIPRHSGLKVFKKGVQSLSRLTASKYKDMMKIMVFVVDGLYSEDLSNVYVKWNEIKRSMFGIRCQAIVMRNRVKKTKTPVAFTYTAKLFDFNFSETIINEHRDNPKLNKNMSKGFTKFIDCLNSYLKLLNTTFEDCRIKIYSSVTLKNGTILHVVNNFHDRPWFSNIAINMDIEELSNYQTDNGICYAQTLLITEIKLPNKLTPLYLALVQWYDFKSEITPFVYGCPLLELVELYNFIEIEAIEDIVHIISRFDKTNEHFVI
ncbi:hypothetical protein Glove_92g54 [Diversispora epigaea]|uniref:Uncharacterized protein n=1 Tax=Diversispora epigaea TaxID=1348612 RepID=A0A397J8S9_9GLOM|nr:hypothetical protein Glove_92g54 [Diversispora epigaea]